MSLKHSKEHVARLEQELTLGKLHSNVEKV